MMILVSFILVFLCGLFNRLRGDNSLGFGKWFEKLAYGLCVALILGIYEPVHFVVFSLLFAIGLTPGYTDAIGAVLEDREMRYSLKPKWYSPEQVTNPWVSLILRGIVLAILPVAYLGYIGLINEAIICFAACSVSYALAGILQRKIPIPSEKIREKLFIPHAWAWWEWWCGFVVGGMCLWAGFLG